MSERIQHRGKLITVTIDGKSCEGIYGQTILEIARENDIYIPTMCYLTKVSPIASCRMCAVNVEGVDGHILSCQEKAVDGAVITTNDESLEHHRTNIMKLYNVNHPLQCGVCDKSGECDLQNKTLEFKVDSQEFPAKDMLKKKKGWGVLSYDPALCIMCERCVHTCNETIGAAALYIKPGGYKSTIDNKMSRCEQCGECITVCPVGAMASTDYKYTTNAWESQKVPATCTHCSSACPLYYDVKHNGIENSREQTITRVVTDHDFDILCGAGKFAYSFENKQISNTIVDFREAIEEIKSCDTIKFNSYITNEEVLILQNLKDKLGVKLVNEDAYNYQNFLNNYSSITGKSLYTATNKTVNESDVVIMLGTRIARDNPVVKYNVNMAIKKQRAEFIYMHPIDDVNLQNKYTQYVKYEVGSEEAVLAMLASYLLKENNDLESSIKEYLDNLDIGHLSGESSVGEEEYEEILQKLIRKKNKTLIIGSDVYGHDRASDIAKLVGIIDKYSDFKVLLIPTSTNTLGVSLLCSLDKEESGKVLGYNVSGDYTISSCGNGDFNTPALNQQEGTFTGLDLKVLNTNVAIPFDGYCLNDLVAQILDRPKENTIDYTIELGETNEYSDVEFDTLNNGYDKYGTDLRGYELKASDVTIDENLSNIADLSSYNGTVIYNCEPLYQFNEYTKKSLTKSIFPKTDSFLKGSKAFATAAKIKTGEKINIVYDGKSVTKVFKLDKDIKGTVAMYPSYDVGLNSNNLMSGYRYKQVKIEKVETTDE
ncbi:MAG: 2Fe-2S iron-sulfur cluster-binding protein [Campylobacterota bacterium]|nr:2Fe-2S iron-sulfur cluster-binding protein [Campylobacterota bacterium]